MNALVDAANHGRVFVFAGSAGILEKRRNLAENRGALLLGLHRQCRASQSRVSHEGGMEVVPLFLMLRGDIHFTQIILRFVTTCQLPELVEIFRNLRKEYWAIRSSAHLLRPRICTFTSEQGGQGGEQCERMS